MCLCRGQSFRKTRLCLPTIRLIFLLPHYLPLFPINWCNIYLRGSTTLQNSYSQTAFILMCLKITTDNENRTFSNFMVQNNDLGTMLHAQTIRNIHLVRKIKATSYFVEITFLILWKTNNGWLKSLFEFFHKMLGKTQINFLAKPIMVELVFILSYLS